MRTITLYIRDEVERHGEKWSPGVLDGDIVALQISHSPISGNAHLYVTGYDPAREQAFEEQRELDDQEIAAVREREQKRLSEARSKIRRRDEEAAAREATGKGGTA